MTSSDLADPGHEVGAVPLQDAGRRGVAGIFEALRTSILEGRWAGGEVLNQVHLARELGVSRTPLREAIRMLQADGLVQAERQQRVRVRPIEAHQVDTLYAQRIMLEAVAVEITLPKLTKSDLHRARELLALTNTSEPEASEARLAAHAEFHALLTSKSSESLRQQLTTYSDYSDRYRRLYRQVDTTGGELAKSDHVAIMSAAAAGDVLGTVRALNLHYSRTAIVVIGSIDPVYVPQAVRTAMRLVTQEDPR
jgi:DNA-binding GntR family transcriptional regulator